jgi:hypothetical protein
MRAPQLKTFNVNNANLPLAYPRKYGRMNNIMCGVERK